MTGDFSRWRAPNARERGYAGVLMQQGRLHTDSDWNENLSILSDLSRTALTAVMGPSGTPKQAAGFAISPGAGGFSIGAGVFWVDGLQVENRNATNYDAQSGVLGLPAFTTGIPDGSEVLIYLEARQTEVSALEDPLLNDPALGGVDTATRIRADWRVGARTITLTTAERDALLAKAHCGQGPVIPEWALSTGRMIATTAPAATLPDDSDCLIPPLAGYLSQENQLYRVQIIQGGSRTQARFVWSRENSCVEARLALNSDGAFVMQGAREDEALGFVSGGWVEVFDDHTLALGQAGTFARITLPDGVVTFVPGIGNFGQMQNPWLRRWDHGGISTLGLELPMVAVTLERGVQVSFTEGTYKPGDFWLFEARAATGSVIWPPYPGSATEAVLPMGWGSHFAPLALARTAGTGIGDVTDLRAIFPALSQLEAVDVCFDNSKCDLGATVQDALEALCHMGGGLCTATVSTTAELLAVMKDLKRGQSIRLCLRGATFALTDTLVFNRLGHVIVEGTGPQTVISVANGEAAFLFGNCASVRVSDLSVNGGPTGSDGPARGRLGALTMIDCGEVQIERVRAKCRNGPDRAAACLATRGKVGTTSVRIRDCDLTVGQAQIGISIVDAGQVWVENNVLTPLWVDDISKVQKRIATDRAQLSRLNRALLWFKESQADFGSGEVTLADGERIGRTFRSLRAEGVPAEVALRGRDAKVAVNLHPALAGELLRVVLDNKRNIIADPAEMRHHLRNLVDEALRSAGRVTVAGNVAGILNPKLFALAGTPFMMQGIVIAGRVLDEVHVTGNRIEGANDGIHIAAGTGEEAKGAWRTGPPTNLVGRAVVNGNTVRLTPLSSATSATGIYFGHVDRLTAGQNAITGVGQTISGNVAVPHQGMAQYGWRGPHLTWTENTVRSMPTGYVVAPNFDGSSPNKVWRLRDNSGDDVGLIHLLATEVEWQ